MKLSELKKISALRDVMDNWPPECFDYMDLQVQVVRGGQSHNFRFLEEVPSDSYGDKTVWNKFVAAMLKALADCSEYDNWCCDHEIPWEKREQQSYIVKWLKGLEIRECGIGVTVSRWYAYSSSECASLEYNSDGEFYYWVCIPLKKEQFRTQVFCKTH